MHPSVTMSWQYIHTDLNPADVGSRSVPPALLKSTSWLTGPAFLKNVSSNPSKSEETYNLIEPAFDSEVRPEVTTSLTHVTKHVVHPQRLIRFSKYNILLTAMAHLIHIARSFSHSVNQKCHGWHIWGRTDKGQSVNCEKRPEQVLCRGTQMLNLRIQHSVLKQPLEVAPCHG